MITYLQKFRDMEAGCEEALRQIEERKYQEELEEEGYERGSIMAYGICFYKKECIVARK